MEGKTERLQTIEKLFENNEKISKNFFHKHFSNQKKNKRFVRVQWRHLRFVSIDRTGVNEDRVTITQTKRMFFSSYRGKSQHSHKSLSKKRLQSS